MSGKAPKATVKNKWLEIHGDRRLDPFYWLNERHNPEVRSYIEKENNYTAEVLKPLDTLKQTIFEEIKARFTPNEVSSKVLKNGYYYYHKYEEGLEYPIYFRHPESHEEKEEIILDVNKLADGHEYYEIGRLVISDDNKILCFAEDTISRRIYTLRFKNLDTGMMYSEKIPGTSADMAWASDNKTLFYVLRDQDTLRAYKVMRHQMSTPIENDHLIYEEFDESFLTSIRRSLSGKYIFVENEATTQTETWLIDSNKPAESIRVFISRSHNHEYHISHQENLFYILTNRDALNFKLCCCLENGDNFQEWTEILPERKDVLIESVSCYSDFVVLEERKNGLINIRIRINNGEDYYVAFPDEAYMVHVGNNFQYGCQSVRLHYNSPSTPPSEFDFDIHTKERKIVYQKIILGGFNPTNYGVKRLLCKSHDMRDIPMTMVYHKHKINHSGPSPLLLYGYGSYGYSLDPYFSVDRLSILDRGIIFVIAHVRGGQELGRIWYEEGKLLSKMNTFLDFISCAEFLVKSGYTSNNSLMAMGGSAGGLLMGVIANLRPSLFTAIVASVPFVDVVTTMLDDSIPLTTFEYDEWGNPHEAVYYQYMKSYSPYDNIVQQEYPSMLITAGWHDSQVQYWEPAKYVAKLRVHNTGSRPILLYTEMDAGHSGASGRYERYKETSLIYAFLLNVVGISN
jgi:oligopeptidase B